MSNGQACQVPKKACWMASWLFRSFGLSQSQIEIEVCESERANLPSCRLAVLPVFAWMWMAEELLQTKSINCIFRVVFATIF